MAVTPKATNAHFLGRLSNFTEERQVHQSQRQRLQRSASSSGKLQSAHNATSQVGVKGTLPKWHGGPPYSAKTPCSRVRTLIFNWPSHFCEESLISLPFDPAPLQPPYRVRIKYDLRRRKLEMQDGKQKAYLVAFDTESLRRLGSGMGINPLEASNSFLARDFVCSDMVPLKPSLGEAVIELRPPDVHEGDVLILLRVIKSSNLRVMQDWYPIGDPVVLRVEPRSFREDRDSIQRLQGELETCRSLDSSMVDPYQQALEQSKESLSLLRSDEDELRVALAQCQGDLKQTQESIKGLHAALETGVNELNLDSQSTAVQNVLSQSRNRIQQSHDDAAVLVSRSLENSQYEIEVAENAIDATSQRLAKMHQDADASFSADSEANKYKDGEAASGSSTALPSASGTSVPNTPASRMVSSSPTMRSGD